MAAVDVVKMERDALKQQLQASQARGVQLQATLLLQQQQQQDQKQQQQQQGVSAASVVESSESGSSPKTFRALAMSEIVEKEQAMQQLQVALDDANNKLLQHEALVRVRTESERQVRAAPCGSKTVDL